MHYRNIQGISKKTSVIGFGAWGVGGATPGATSYGDITDNQAYACLETAISRCVNFFDTSPVYGHGQSEIRLGRVLKNNRGQMIVATKGGLYDYRRKPDFSVPVLASELQGSLARLGTHYVDAYQLHNPPSDILRKNPELTAFFDAIKKQEKATIVGISVKAPADAFKLLKAYPFEAIQINLNMMDVRAIEIGLLDYCAQNDISVFVRTPLCFGYLSLTINEKSIFDDADHRSRWSVAQKAIWTRGARQTQAVAEAYDPEKAKAASRAIRFCLLHPAVKTVLTGAMTAKEALENADAGYMSPLQDGCLDAILALNQKQTFVEG